MIAIYEPKGAAREYAERALNFFTGCAHRCTYCYVPGLLRIKSETFHSEVMERLCIREAIIKEAPKHAGKEILLSLTSDPFCLPGSTLVPFAISTLGKAGCKVRLLTKAGGLATRKSLLDLYQTFDVALGMTIHTFDTGKDMAFEPCTAFSINRLHWLNHAHDRGIRTWVSVEPVLDTQDALGVIHELDGVADEIWVGRLNHHGDHMDYRAVSGENRCLTLPTNRDLDIFSQAVIDLAEVADSKIRLKADLVKVSSDPRAKQYQIVPPGKETS